MSNKILVLTPSLQSFHIWADEILQAYEAMDLFEDKGTIDFSYQYPAVEYVGITRMDQMRGLRNVVGVILLRGYESMDIDFYYLRTLCKEELWVKSWR